MTKGKKIFSRSISYIIAAAGVLVILLPFYVTLITAFKTPQESAQNFFAFPKTLYLENFKTVFAKAGYFKYGCYGKLPDSDICSGHDDILLHCAEHEAAYLL